MGGISLAKVLQSKSLKNSRILAGKDQLERLVTGVTVGEVPDIANWLTGGELVLSTFFAVSSDPKAISMLAKNIINGPAAALAVKPARFLESLPSEVLNLADKLNFPVIEVPSDVRWTTIIADVYEAMAKIAVEIARTRAIEEAEARVYGDFLNDLTASRIPLDQVDSRIVKLGGDFSKGYAVLYCTFDPEEKFKRFYRETLRFIGYEAPGSLLVEHKGDLVIMLAQTGELAKISRAKYIRETAKNIITIADMSNAKVAVGVSRIRMNAAEILRAMDEAKIALDTGCRLSGAGSFMEFDQVGIYRLLLPLARESKADGRLYYEETVGRLAEYDRQHGTDLVQTLEAFRRNNENVALAADELYTHRHTVRYRLQRIAEITACDPFMGAEREKLYMGLHIKYLLNL